MTRELVTSSSLEWLLMVEAGRIRNENLQVLKTAQAVAAMFDKDAWREMQDKLSR